MQPPAEIGSAGVFIGIGVKKHPDRVTGVFSGVLAPKGGMVTPAGVSIVHMLLYVWTTFNELRCSQKSCCS